MKALFLKSFCGRVVGQFDLCGGRMTIEHTSQPPARDPHTRSLVAATDG
jgi:hypothetical protein